MNEEVIRLKLFWNIEGNGFFLGIVCMLEYMFK